MRLFGRLAAEPGSEHVRAAKLMVRLAGRWQSPTGARYPVVDAWGRMHLGRLSGLGPEAPPRPSSTIKLIALRSITA
jgi:hypothetical protein